MRQLKIIPGKLGGAMKVVVYGPEGIGKSTLAAKFPRPLFIDTEGSTRHMDVQRTERPTSWAMLLELVRCIKADPGLCSTLVIDTADWAEQLCITSICDSKRISGIEDMGYGKGYVYVAEEFGRLLNLLEEAVDNGIHVVLTAHAMMRKFEQPDEMGAYDRWELKLQKKTAALVKEWADLLLFANYKTLSVAVDDKGKKFKPQGGRRVMFTTHHPCWDAKNRLGLPEELPLEFAPLAPYFDAAAVSAPTTAPAPAPAPPAEAAPNPADTSPTAPEQPAPQTDNAQELKAKTSTLKALQDLMEQGGVLDYEVKAAVAAKGYFPEDMPIEDYPDDFIKGVLIGAWRQVHEWIEKNRAPLPF